jgi:uncharacterized protein YaaW (UPF0174 family)
MDTTKEFYQKIWKHLADKYDSESSSVENIMNEKTIHAILTRYFSHLSETEKQNLLNELRQQEAAANIPAADRI